MLEFYRRLRHSFGFGVHSPFAFRMVRDVVRAPRGAHYYAGNELRETLRGLPRGERRRCRLLFRLAARLGFRHVCVSPLTSRAVENSLHAALPGAGFRVRLPRPPAPGTLVVCRAGELPPDFSVAAWPAGCVLVITRIREGRANLETALASIRGGWTFEGRRMAILAIEHSQPLCRLQLLLP